jgi:uncharacterized protein YggU (UPF0235/DUF167 family)
VEYRIKVIPDSKKELVELMRDGRLSVAVDAPRTQGRALVAKYLGIASGRVSVVRGQNQSTKVLAIKGD